MHTAEIKLGFDDVLIQPIPSSVNSRKDVNLLTTYSFKKKDGSTFYWQGIPIVAANMDTIGTFKVASILSKYRMLTCLHKHYSLEDYKMNNFESAYVAVTTGIDDSGIEKTLDILYHYPQIRFVCIDVANGYTDSFLKKVEHISNACKEQIIIAGNITTYEGSKNIRDAGADVVKVGIGNGSACKTKQVTGVGYPQLSAIQDSRGHLTVGHTTYVSDIKLMSDGGCKQVGDISKAFVAGAKFVMLGGMLAGHKETGLDYYGMSSERAMNKYSGGMASYRTSEGTTLEIEDKGYLDKTILHIMGGLRSMCTYVNCRNLSDVIDNTSGKIVLNRVQK